MPTVDNPVTDYIPNARPGSRAPHVYFERDGKKVSTIDIIGNGFTLLTAGRGHQWLGTVQGMADVGGIPFQAISIDEGKFASVYELEPDGAVLVRPDGYVAWRSRSMASDPVHMVNEVFSMILR